MTETRRIWLAYLAKHGEVGWEKMPRRRTSLMRDAGAVTSRTWRPMVSAGLIEARFYVPHFAKPIDWYFKITDVGRKSIVGGGP